MSAIFNSLNAHNLLFFQPILMILVSKFMVYRALSDKTYLSLGLLVKLPSQLSILGHNRHASETSFKWRFAGGADGPLIVVFG